MASLCAVSRSQRLAFLAVAVVIAVVAVIVLSGGSGDGGGNTTSGDVVLGAGSVKKLTAKEGDTVSFSVKSDKQQEVHVHGYDLKQDAAPDKPAHFSFKATITGRFEIEFEESATQIGELTVEPK
jgi:hypothetical protein